jgi:two-component system LytT family sensor kinase
MKHGVGKAGGRGRIEVTARRSGDSLLLTVFDSGSGPLGHGAGLEPGTGEDGSGVGLANTRARLRELYGPAQELLLRTEPEGGVTALIRIPFRAPAQDSPGPSRPPAVEGAHA